MGLRPTNTCERPLVSVMTAQNDTAVKDFQGSVSEERAPSVVKGFALVVAR